MIKHRMVKPIRPIKPSNNIRISLLFINQPDKICVVSGLRTRQFSVSSMNTNYHYSNWKDGIDVIDSISCCENNGIKVIQQLSTHGNLNTKCYNKLRLCPNGDIFLEILSPLYQETYMNITKDAYYDSSKYKT